MYATIIFRFIFHYKTKFYTFLHNSDIISLFSKYNFLRSVMKLNIKGSRRTMHNMNYLLYKNNRSTFSFSLFKVRVTLFTLENIIVSFLNLILCICKVFFNHLPIFERNLRKSKEHQLPARWRSPHPQKCLHCIRLKIF